MAKSKFEKYSWTKLGSGSYNNVYISADKQFVLKIQKENLNPKDIIADRPERSVRIWNEINPDLPASLLEMETGKVWICPYVFGTEPSDKEISSSVIDIFNRTGRIVTDAPGRSNFVKTPAGKIICIDVGFALKLERRTQDAHGSLKRYKSEVSLTAWDNVRHNYASFFADASLTKPTTVNTVKALLFIQNNRPDLCNVSFLNADFIQYFAKAYHKKNIQNALTLLDDLSTIKCSEKNTSLMLAAKHGFLSELQELIKEGADINDTNKLGFNALMYAAFNGQLSVVQCLLSQKNIKVNAVNKFYDTPLILAVMHGDERVIDALLQNGADIHCKNDQGLNAAEVAAAHGHPISDALKEKIIAFEKTTKSCTGFSDQQHSFFSRFKQSIQQALPSVCTRNALI